jgi:hypothetical protein
MNSRSSRQLSGLRAARAPRRSRSRVAILGLIVIVSLLLPGGLAWGQSGGDPSLPTKVLTVETPLPSIGPEAVLAVAPADGPAAAASPAPVPAPAGALGPAAPGLDATFAGVTFDTNPTYNGGFLFIPPDPIAVAGPSHVVSVVNCMIEWRPKSGVAGTVQSLAGFFTSLTPANTLFDPKVIYDQYAGRFVVVALEQVANPTSSRILVAVSKTSDPTAGWWFTAINSKINISGVDRWADYPGLGLDDKAIYITSNMFSWASSFGGVRLWIINKTPFYTGGVASVTVNDPIPAGFVASTTQPTHMFGALPATMGTFLVLYSGLGDGTNEYVQITRVDNPLTVPTFSAQQILLGNIEGNAALPGAPQLGSAQTINTNDRRAQNAVWRDNALWTTFEILPGSAPDAGQVTAHWLKLNTGNLAALTVADQGNVGGEEIATGAYTFFPSIAVDPCGNMALGFAASASTIYPGAYYTGRAAGDAAGTVQPSGTLKAGTDWYYRTFGGGRNRWGDYSGISLDPADEATFWVFNEYAMQRGTLISGEDGRWATQYGSFRINTAGFDFGDLPASYGITLRAADGARHCAFPNGLRLGASIDAESEAWQSADALGDDTHGVADEDGVTRANTPWQDGVNGGAVNVTVSGGPGVVYGWIDWNGDGDFLDADEQIISGTAVARAAAAASGESAPVATTLIQFAVPAGTFPGAGPNKVFNARFRLYPSAPLNPTWIGTGPAGEVEDYQWTFLPTAVTLGGLEAGASAGPGVAAMAGAALITLTAGWAAIRRRRR